MYKYNDTIKMLKFIPAYCLVKNTGYRLYTVCSMSVCVCVCMYMIRQICSIIFEVVLSGCWGSWRLRDKKYVNCSYISSLEFSIINILLLYFIFL